MGHQATSSVMIRPQVGPCRVSQCLCVRHPPSDRESTPRQPETHDFETGHTAHDGLQRNRNSWGIATYFVGNLGNSISRCSTRHDQRIGMREESCYVHMETHQHRPTMAAGLVRAWAFPVRVRIFAADRHPERLVAKPRNQDVGTMGEIT